MEAVMGVLLGIGLGAACGFRIFVPLLVAAIAIRGGFLTVTPEFAWLGGTAALVTLSVATLLEIAAYYIPVIDHTLDVLGAPAAIVAGTILAAGFIGSNLVLELLRTQSRRYGRTGQLRRHHGGNGFRLYRRRAGLRSSRRGRSAGRRGHLLPGPHGAGAEKETAPFSRRSGGRNLAKGKKPPSPGSRPRSDSPVNEGPAAFINNPPPGPRRRFFT